MTTKGENWQAENPGGPNNQGVFCESQCLLLKTELSPIVK